jgi:hypothetical protein
MAHSHLIGTIDQDERAGKDVIGHGREFDSNIPTDELVFAVSSMPTERRGCNTNRTAHMAEVFLGETAKEGNAPMADQAVFACRGQLDQRHREATGDEDEVARR